MVDTLRLGGIKLSGELVQIDFHESRLSAEKFTSLLQKVAAAEIAIPHLHQARGSGELQSTLCLSLEDFPRVKGAVDSLLHNSRSRILPAVGTITLFPHRSAVNLFISVVHALAGQHIPLHGISTSVSALVIHTDYDLLDKGVEAILTVCELPENHTPLRPVVLLGDQAVETVAVYWEPKIRIYGMDVQRGLCHYLLHCPETVLNHEKWRSLGKNQEKFRLLTAHKEDENTLRCNLLVEKSWRDSLSSDLQTLLADEPTLRLNCDEYVDMVSFHGPHFQDRFGIAERVFTALHEAGISLVLSGCTGTSVHVVVAAGEGDSAARCLEQLCTIP